MPLYSLTSLRLGSTIRWKNENFFFIDSKKFNFFEEKLKRYFNSVFLALNHNHSSIIKSYYSSYSLLHLKKSKFKSPILLGFTKLKLKSNKLNIFLNYYFDAINSHPDKVNLLRTLLLNVKDFLKSILNIEIILIDYNYNNIFFNSMEYFSKLTKLRIVQPSFLTHYKAYNYTFTYFKRINRFYIYIVKKLFRFKKNRYFYRILNVIFSSFLLKKIDSTLITNSIAYEIRGLRKQHRKFLIFVSKIFRSLFNLFKKSLNLGGIKLIFSGRLTLFNRENQRKIKKVFIFGKHSVTSNYSYSVDVANSEAFTRFGAVNVLLSISYFSLNKNYAAIPPIYLNSLTGLGPEYDFLCKKFSNNANLYNSIYTAFNIKDNYNFHLFFTYNFNLFIFLLLYLAYTAFYLIQPITINFFSIYYNAFFAKSNLFYFSQTSFFFFYRNLRFFFKKNLKLNNRLVPYKYFNFFYLQKNLKILKYHFSFFNNFKLNFLYIDSSLYNSIEDKIISDFLSYFIFKDLKLFTYFKNNNYKDYLTTIYVFLNFFNNVFLSFSFFLNTYNYFSQNCIFLIPKFSKKSYFF